MVAPLCNNLENIKNNKNEEQASADTDTNLDNIRYTYLYVIGKIWIDVLKTCLVGENFHLFPVVKADKAEEPPKKPPYMKFKDLSLYKSPHCDYKEYERDKIKCPDRKVKLLPRSVLLYVKDGREMYYRALCKATGFIKGKTRNAGEAISKSKNEFKQTMRDPDNLAVRQAVVATGGLAGYLFGGGGGIPRRLFFTSAGLLSTGALCFPKETDETFRNAAYVAAKCFFVLYNKWCGKNIFREKLACRDELPEHPPEQPPLEDPEQPPEQPPLEDPEQPPEQPPLKDPEQPPEQPPLEAPEQPPEQPPLKDPEQPPEQPPLKDPEQPPEQPPLKDPPN